MDSRYCRATGVTDLPAESLLLSMHAAFEQREAGNGMCPISRI
jgi:hypothetical protein